MPISTMMPGMGMTRKAARVRGFAVLLVAASVIAGFVLWPSKLPAGSMEVRLELASVSDSVRGGAAVVVDDVVVGHVLDVERRPGGTVELGLVLDREGTSDLTSAMDVSFSPVNMWGITGIALRPVPGGTPLRDGARIQVESDKVMDAGLTSFMDLLEPLIKTAGEDKTLTALNWAAADGETFLPFWGAVVNVVMDAQRARGQASLTDVIAAEAAALGPAVETGGALLGAFDRISSAPGLQTDAQRARLNEVIEFASKDALPALSNLFGGLGENFSGYTDEVAPLLTAAASALPRPEQSANDLRQLLIRAGRSFATHGGRPTLEVRLRLATVPAIAEALGITSEGRR